MQYLRKSGSLWYKYFISYIVIFAIPLIILSVVLYNHAINELQNEIEKYTLDKVTRMSESMDTRLIETKKIALKISSDQAITPFAANLNDYRSKYAIDQLNRYWDKNFIDNLFVHFKGEDYIYNVVGKMSFNTMYKSVLGIDDNIAVQFSNILKNVEDSTLFGITLNSSSASASKDALILLYPLPLGGVSHYGTVGMIINQNTIENIAGDVFGGSKGTLFVFDSEGKIIFILGDKSFFPEEEVGKIASNNHPVGISSTYHNGRKLSIIKKVSDTSGFRYVLVMSPESYLSRVITIKRQVMLVIVAVLIIGVFLAFVFSGRSYRPVRSLFEKVNKYASSSVQFAKLSNPNETAIMEEQNEIDRIEKIFESIIEKNYGLTEQLNFHQDFVKDQIILMLLKGQLNNRKDVEKLLEQYNMKLDYEYYVVSAISIYGRKENETDTWKIKEYVKNIVDRLVNDKDFYCVDTVQGEYILLLNSKYENCTPDAIRKTLKSIQASIKSDLELDAYIGVGRVYDGIEHISMSFVEAFSALEYVTMTGNENIIFFDEIVYMDKMADWYPVEEQMKLTQCIKQGNIYIFKHIIEDIIKSINEKHLSVGKTKTICFGMINKIVEILNELNIKEFDDEIEELTTFSSLNDFKVKMEDVVYKISRFIGDKKASNNEALKISVINYIHENFNNNMLSLDMVAEEFNISTKYLSRFFKEQMGSTFTDYIKELRISYAKKLLKETDKSVKDIVQEVGYTDVASFTRTFRQMEGITPGKYREVTSGEVNEMYEMNNR